METTEQDRVLHVANLDARVSQQFIYALFSQIGPVTGIQMVHDAASEPCALIEFADHYAASHALQIMDNRLLLDKVMEVKWMPKPPAIQKKVDVANQFHVFVGDLSPDVDSDVLRKAFAPYGEVSAAKVIFDQVTLKSKGYGFVSYPKRAEAERAIKQMNGQWVGKRAVRTNWATRKTTNYSDSNADGSEVFRARPLSYEEVLSQTGPENTTVFVGNIHQGISDEEILARFQRFGNVDELRRFKVYGNSFLTFGSKEVAARAIYEMNGTELMGQTLRCSWGKSDSSRNGSQMNSYYQLSQMNQQYPINAQYGTNSQYILPQFQQYPNEFLYKY